MPPTGRQACLPVGRVTIYRIKMINERLTVAIFKS